MHMYSLSVSRGPEGPGFSVNGYAHFNSVQQVTVTLTYNETVEEGEIQSSWK